MLTVKVRVPQQKDYSPILPLLIPELSEVRAFSMHVHKLGQPWSGEVYGWPAAYSPERRTKPAGSKMTFTPADFWIGESGIWFYSLMWEKGRDEEPSEFLDDRGIVKDEPAPV